MRKILIALLAYAAVGLNLCSAEIPANKAQEKKETTHPVKNRSLTGRPAPDFTVTTLDGKEVSLSDYKGKAVVVNFWATWCMACRQEMPWLAELREQYSSQGMEVLGIVTDGASDEMVKKAVDSYGVKYPILHCNHKTAQAYGGLPYLPMSFYIDRHGIVAARMSGASSKAEIEAVIKKIVATKER